MFQYFTTTMPFYPVLSMSRLYLFIDLHFLSCQLSNPRHCKENYQNWNRNWLINLLIGSHLLSNHYMYIFHTAMSLMNQINALHFTEIIIRWFNFIKNFILEAFFKASLLLSITAFSDYRMFQNEPFN